MSFFPAKDPAAGDRPACDAIEQVIVPRTGDVGGFTVRRALPHAQRRMVGPFIFFDQLGPAEFRAGQGIDVRPHPHIGLATATYLFDGEIVHRDNLGNDIPIRPSELNWMTAGRGIVHSERTAAQRRVAGEKLHGLQCWVALPAEHEEMNPGFVHHGAAALPRVDGEGKTVRIIVGALFGARAPVDTLWDTLFAEARLDPGASLPIDAAYEERAVYIVAGEIDVHGDKFAAGQLVVFRPGDRMTVTAARGAHLIILGGAPMDGPRHIWWNFVSSSRERIEQAKADWREGRFGLLSGDSEFIPLPEG
jgi:redox-sensitive bicupin YhaK (pirin superfamily)